MINLDVLFQNCHQVGVQLFSSLGFPYLSSFTYLVPHLLDDSLFLHLSDCTTLLFRESNWQVTLRASCVSVSAALACLPYSARTP